jgi:hypothetical protein
VSAEPLLRASRIRQLVASQLAGLALALLMVQHSATRGRDA